MTLDTAHLEFILTSRWRGRYPRRLPLDAVLIALSATTIALIAAWLFAGGGDANAQLVVTGFAAPVIDLMAVGFVAMAARRVNGRRARLAWRLIAVAMLVYAVGDGMWAWIEIIQGQDAFPSTADIAYTAFYPIIVGALLLLPAASLVKREAVRLGIDSAIVVIGGGMVVWHSLLRPALTAAQPDAITAVLTLGYPIGDLVLLFGVATIGLRRPAGMEPRALVALVGGMALMFVADISYAELTLVGAPAQHSTDIVYLVSSMAIALAGYFQAHPAQNAADDESRGLNRWLILLPYAGLVAGFGVLLGAAQGSVGGLVGDLLDGAVALTILVLVRQELVLRENTRLLSDSARRASEARFHSLEANTSDAILLVDPQGNVGYASTAVERVLGLEVAALLGRPVARLAHAEDVGRLEKLIADAALGRPVAPLEWRLWSRDGAWRQVESVAANLLDDPMIGKIVLTTRDVRERRALKQQLTQAAFHDLLTGLPNRALFHDRLERALVSAQRTRVITSIVSLDLDGFRRINDSLGHAIGDLVLQEAARRVTASIQAADTVARLGGDEFVILIDGASAITEAADVAERIRAALHVPMTIGGTTLQLTASMGIAVAEAGAEANEPSALIRNANVAMSISRERGRDRVVVFEASMREALESQIELESDLRGAIAANELILHYQPIVDLQTRELVGAEALVRWDHPTRGRLGPNVFIPLAEETGLIGEIGAWVLQTACLEVARWARAAPHRVPRVSVNLSAPQIADPQLPWIVQSALAQAAAAPGWLTLEVTESMLVDDTAAVLERLHAIRALGVQISVDDFGTGYSSLAYLQQFPVSHIKIDRSFVTPLDDPGQGLGVAGAVVAIGKALGMSTIAEGIETERQLERLRAIGCPLGQGFLLGRPQDAAATLLLVGASAKSPPATSPGLTPVTSSVG